MTSALRQRRNRRAQFAYMIRKFCEAHGDRFELPRCGARSGIDANNALRHRGSHRGAIAGKRRPERPRPRIRRRCHPACTLHSGTVATLRSCFHLAQTLTEGFWKLPVLDNGTAPLRALREYLVTPSACGVFRLVAPVSEAGGDAALYAPPDDAPAFADAVQRIFGDDALCATQLAWAPAFGIERFARTRLLDLVERSENNQWTFFGRSPKRPSAQGGRPHSEKDV